MIINFIRNKTMKKLIRQWAELINESIDSENTGVESVMIPSNEDWKDKKKVIDFFKVVDSWFPGGGAYDFYVPEDVEWEASIQTDVDDFDEYIVKARDVVSEDELWEIIMNFVYDKGFKPGDVISKEQFFDALDSGETYDKVEQEIMKLDDEYDPSSSETPRQTWAGKYRIGGYYPDA